MPGTGSVGPGDFNGSLPLPPAVTRWPIPGGDDATTPAAPFRAGVSAKPAHLVAAEPETEVDLPWDTTAEQGEVEAAFEEDVAKSREGMMATARREEFPVDAFIIPEDSQRVPTGLDPAKVEAVKHHTEHPLRGPAHDMADRFEKLSRRLRSENVDTLLTALARGDRVDSLLAGFLAGYFATKSH